MTTVRTVIVIAALKHWPLSQIDVHNALLNGDFFEKVYMTMPRGFGSLGRTGFVDSSNPYMA